MSSFLGGDWSRQLGLKRRERNVVEPVLSVKVKNNRYIVTGADSCISKDLF